MLPEEWNHRTVDDLADVLTGFAFESDKYVEQSVSSVRLLRGDNITPGALRWMDAKHWPTPTDNLSRFELDAGDIVIALDRPIVGNGLKLSVIRDDDLPCLLVQRVARVRARPGVNQAFLAHALRSHQFVDHLKGQKTETAVPHVSPNDVRAFQVYTPAYAEQAVIASILGVWDAAIATTERLLANSCTQKEALASRILFGKARLAPFNDASPLRATPCGRIPAHWQYPRIEEIAHEISQRQADGAPYPVLSCTKHAGLVDSLKYFKKQVFSKDLSTYKVVPRGAFAYATNHIEEGAIGYQSLYDFALVSPIYTAFGTADRVHDGYLYRVLKTERFRQVFEAATNSSVDRRGSLRWKDFKKIHVPLPSLKEQAMIAAVLDKADSETALLEKQVQALRAEKSALMQQLLTGKRRVRLPAATEASPA